MTESPKASSALNHEGYIESADFGWAGLVLPEEYAPYLTDESGRHWKVRIKNLIITGVRVCLIFILLVFHISNHILKGP